MKKRLIIIMFLAGITTIASAATRYHALNLNKVAVDSCAPIIPSAIYGINDSGLIVGYGYPPNKDANSQFKPFVYNPATGVFIVIPNFAGDSNNYAYGGKAFSINNLGFVTGYENLTSDSYASRGFIFGDLNHNGVVDSGEMINLNPDGNSTIGKVINIHNQVVGYNLSTNPTSGWVWTDKNGNYQYDDGEKQLLGPAVSNVVSINDSCQIVIYDGNNSFLWNDSNGNGIYEDSEKQIMPIPAGYTKIMAENINNNGAISGEIYLNVSQHPGFYWIDNNHNGVIEVNEYYIFGSPMHTTFARGMNNLNQVVGGTFTWDVNFQNIRASYIWTAASGMVNLNNVTDIVHEADPNWDAVWFVQAEAINNNGVIITSGSYHIYTYNGDPNGKTFDINDPNWTKHNEQDSYVLTPYTAGNLDSSGNINFRDFRILAANFGNKNCIYDNGYCGGADIDQNGRVDLADLEILTEGWLTDN